MIRVSIADDSAIMRISLRQLLKQYTDVELVGESSDGQEAIASVKLNYPDVLVMDIRMPVLDGFSATKIIKDLEVSTCVILISSGVEDYLIRQAVKAGARSYVQKDSLAKLLLPAIRAVYQGETFFGS